ncbi:MAG: efflux RND transporter permease subunit [Desulfobacterales bacterium]
MKQFQFLINFVHKHPRITLLLIMIVSLPLAYFFSRQTHNNHVEIFFQPDDPRYAAYREFQETYGNEEFAVIAIQGDIFRNKTLHIIRKMTAQIENISGVERVNSITSMEEFTGSEDTVFLEKIIPEGTLTGEQLKAAQDRAYNNKILRDSLLSGDGLMTALHVELESMSEREKHAAVREIVRVSKSIAGNHFKLYCSGLTLVEVELNRLSESDFIIFIPVIFVLIFIFIVILLRQMVLAVLCQLNLFVILIWGIGFFVLCGEKFNMVTTVLGAVALAIAIADSIHILSHLQDRFQRHGSQVVPATVDTIKQVWFPCLLTSLTTGAGFMSFTASDIRPVSILGLFTAISVMFAFLLSVTALPALLIVMKERVARSFEKKSRKQKPSINNERFTRALSRIGAFTIQRKTGLFVLFLIAIGIAVAGMAQIKFETNTMKYLPDDNPFKSDLTIIEKHFGGTIPFVILIQSKSGREFSDPAAVRMIDTIQTDLLREIPQFTGAFSIADYMKEFNKAFNNNDPAFYTIPENQTDIADAYELGDPEILDRIITPDHKEVCMVFRSIWDSNEAAYTMNDRVVAYLKSALGNDYSYVHTGLSALYLTMDKHIQESQIKSFFLAFIIIFFMMLFVCRSFKLALISMVPNLFPIAVTLGIMGWFNIPLDVATTMIASVTIGIAVDDTIHFVSWLRKNCSRCRDVNTAIVQTFMDVGKPICMTTLILFAGFFVLVLGSVLPTKAFGVLTAFSMFFALLGDFFVLPVLILIFKPKLPVLEEGFGLEG